MEFISRRFEVLAALQAAMGGTIALVTAVVYYLSPQSLFDASLTVAMAGCGAVVASYYLSVHQILKKKNQLKLSTIILSSLSSLNILLLIAATGGIDSPYYALWLLGIVIAGFFGGLATICLLAASVGYFIYDFSLRSFEQSYMVNHIAQIGLTVATGIIAEWIHVSLGRGNTPEMVKLSGKLSEESLKSSALMASVGEGVLVVDTNRRIQLFNPAAIRLTGWDAKSAQGIDYRLVLNLRDSKGEKLSDEADPFTRLWQSGKSLDCKDLTMETKSGRKLAVSISVSPIYDNEKQLSGGIALFRDVSAEKEVERQRNEFISTASHEMRTPVAAIEGYLSLATNPAVATIDDRAKQYIDKAHASTQHLGELFRDLLSITKMEDNRDITEEVFDLTKLVEDVVSDMKFQADKKGLDLQFAAGEQKVRGEHMVMPVYAVKANPQRIREVLMNLLENALKFTPEGSVHVNINGNNDTATVSIIDSGIGIATEDIPHLFQKFYRIDSSATRTIGGNGLGLYLCRTIVERAKGRIWIESKLGEGSAFKFSLPRLSSDKVGKKVVLAANEADKPAAASPAAMPAAPAPVLPTATQPASKPVTLTDIAKPAAVK